MGSGQIMVTYCIKAGIFLSILKVYLLQKCLMHVYYSVKLFCQCVNIRKYTNFIEQGNLKEAKTLIGKTIAEVEDSESSHCALSKV